MRKRVFAALLALPLLLSACAGPEPAPAGPPLTVGSGESGDIAKNKPSAPGVSSETAAPEPEPEPEPEPVPEPEPDSEPDPAGELLAGMTDRQLICQLLVAAPEALSGGGTVTAWTPELTEALETYPLGGLVLFRDNIADCDQLTALIADAQGASEIGLLIACDEEGGRVTRLMNTLGTTKLGPMYGYRSEGPDRALANARTVGADMLALGFNTDFAPVADVWTNPDNPVIGDRAYSDDPQEAAKLVAAAVRGFHEAGILCTLKHFPGHGDTAEDSHTGAATVTLSEEEIWAAQLPPFIAGIDAGADLVMVGHLTVPALDSEMATVSHAIVTDLLRGELGFDGVIITDSLQMSAAAELYGPGELAVRALEAGCDLLLMPEDLPAAVEAVESALREGRLTRERLEDSARRVLELKLIWGITE